MRKVNSSGDIKKQLCEAPIKKKAATTVENNFSQITMPAQKFYKGNSFSLHVVR